MEFGTHVELNLHELGSINLGMSAFCQQYTRKQRSRKITINSSADHQLLCLCLVVVADLGIKAKKKKKRLSPTRIKQLQILKEEFHRFDSYRGGIN